MKSWIKPVTAAMPAALLLVVVLTGQALAFTWGPAADLTTHGSASEQAGPHSLVTLGNRTAVAIYAQDSNIYVRRTSNSGSTWQIRSALSVTAAGVKAFAPAISGRGSDIDAVWADQDSGDGNRIRYSRSTNRGASYAVPVTLASWSDLDHDVPTQDVAHGPNGVVAVAWDDTTASRIRIRVSTNNGVSFAPTKTIAKSFDYAFGAPSVAVGNGVIYVAYFRNDSHIMLRRSIDNGATWDAATAISNRGAGIGLSVTAEGSHAYVAYATLTYPQSMPYRFSTQYRRTTDHGSSWSAAMDLSQGPNESSDPTLYLSNGVLRAAYHQCGSGGCGGDSTVQYEQTTNGTTWSEHGTVAKSSIDSATPVGIGAAGRIIVLYIAHRPHSTHDFETDLFARAAHRVSAHPSGVAAP